MAHLRASLFAYLLTFTNPVGLLYSDWRFYERACSVAREKVAFALKLKILSEADPTVMSSCHCPDFIECDGLQSVNQSNSIRTAQIAPFNLRPTNCRKKNENVACFFVFFLLLKYFSRLVLADSSVKWQIKKNKQMSRGIKRKVKMDRGLYKGKQDEDMN